MFLAGSYLLQRIESVPVYTGQRTFDKTAGVLDTDCDVMPQMYICSGVLYTLVPCEFGFGLVRCYVVNKMLIQKQDHY